MCNQCEESEAMVLVRGTVTDDEIGLCYGCADRVRRTMTDLQVIGPVESPQAKVAWAKREIKESVCAMIDALSLPEILRGVPFLWLPSVYMLNELAELRLKAARPPREKEAKIGGCDNIGARGRGPGGDHLG